MQFIYQVKPNKYNSTNHLEYMPFIYSACSSGFKIIIDTDWYNSIDYTAKKLLNEAIKEEISYATKTKKSITCVIEPLILPHQNLARLCNTKISIAKEKLLTNQCRLAAMLQHNWNNIKFIYKTYLKSFSSEYWHQFTTNYTLISLTVGDTAKLKEQRLPKKLDEELQDCFKKYGVLYIDGFDKPFFTMEEVCELLWNKVVYPSYGIFYLYIREWMDNIKYNLKIIIINGKVKGISYDKIITKELLTNIVKCIYDAKLPYKNCVVNMVESSIVEIIKIQCASPWTSSKIGLFHWINDYKILYDNTDKIYYRY